MLKIWVGEAVIYEGAGSCHAVLQEARVTEEDVRISVEK
jgi:hypothetical protein